MEEGSCGTVGFGGSGGTTPFTETLSGGASGGLRKGTRGGPVALIHIRLDTLEFIVNLKMRLGIEDHRFITII